MGHLVIALLWPTLRSNGQTVMFYSCGFFFFYVFMAALRSRCGHYIFALWFPLSSSFFPHLISAVADWMSVKYLHTWRGLSANLGCKSETCCTWLAENTGRKTSTKIRHLGAIAQLCRAISRSRPGVSPVSARLNSRL